MTTTRRHLRGWRLGLLGVTLAVPLQASALPQPPATILTPPPLPPQPGVPAPSCVERLGQPGQWSLVTRQRTAAPRPVSGSLFPDPGYQVTVDPQLPCRMYRVRDAQTLERSVDSGRTWTTVFHDTAAAPDAGVDPTCGPPLSGCALTGVPFTASSIDVPRTGVPGLIALGERGNGDAAVVSRDAGATWSLADGPATGGLASIAGHRVLRLLTAQDGDPTHDVFGYAVVQVAPGPSTAVPAAGGAQAIYDTTDGGATWLPAPWQPDAGTTVPAIDAVAVSPVPRLPMLVWVVAQGELRVGTSAATTGSGGGSTMPMVWTDLGAVPDAPVRQLLVMAVRSGLRAVVVGAGGHLHYADLGFSVGGGSGTSPVAWHPVAVPAGVRVTAVAVSAAGGALAAGTDVSRPSAHRVRVLVSRDGFASTQEVAAPPTGPYAEAEVRTPLVPAVGAAAPPEAVVQADDAGSFYVGIDACLAPGSGGKGGSPSCHQEEQSYWRYTPALPPPGRSAGDGAITGGGSQPPAEVLSELAVCPLVAAGESSPLAFDGVDLLYPDPSSTPRAPDTDIIDVLDTRTCLSTPPRSVTVHFDFEETRYIVCSTRPCSSFSIDDLTYDPTRHVIWFVAGTSHPLNGYLFTAPWPTLAQPAVTDVQAHVAFLPAHRPQGCGGGDLLNLAYDASDDSLWTCSWDGAERNTGDFAHIIGDHIRATDGGNIPDPCYTRSGAVNAPSYVGLPGYQYQWDETDAQIALRRWNGSTCGVVRNFIHAPIAEPLSEDEQLVCDPLTFTQVRGWTGPEETVFWLRESGVERIVAFASPDAACPLPTAMSLTAPLAACGQPLTISAGLRLQGPGLPLPRQLAEVSLDGAAAGSAVTGPDGVARLTVPAPAMPGQYTLTVRYSGTDRLLPSAATTTLDARIGCATPMAPPRDHAPVPAPGLIAAPPGPPLEPPVPVSGPAPQPQLQPGAQPQAEAQTQMQAQAQSQGQAQSQAALMPQRQVQRRVQISTATWGRNATHATAMPSPQRAGGAAALMATATIALLFALRRSRPVVARITTDRHQERAGCRRFHRP